MKSMMDRENQRVRLTKRMLRESMLELLKEKSVESISVKELCERAEINRSTFYTHYCDVFEMYKELETELLSSLDEYIRRMKLEYEEDHRGDGSEADPIQLMLEYFRTHADLCRVLLFSSPLDAPESTQVKAQRETIDHLMKLYPAMDPVHREYVLQFCVQGGNGIIFHWMKSGFNMEPAELAGMIRAYTSSVVRSASE